jgi:excisionase family DNA binding protein
MAGKNAISDWLTVTQASWALRCSPARVCQLLDQGRIRFIATRAGRLIDPDDLLRLCKEREAAAAARGQHASGEGRTR